MKKFELRTPFTSDQEQWLRHHLISIMMEMAHEEAAVKRVKIRLNDFIESLKKHSALS